MSIATVVTRGYGSFGSVYRIPTLGYGGGSGPTLVYGPVRITAETFISQPDLDVCFPQVQYEMFVSQPEFEIELP